MGPMVSSVVAFLLSNWRYFAGGAAIIAVFGFALTAWNSRYSSGYEAGVTAENTRLTALHDAAVKKAIEQSRREMEAVHKREKDALKEGFKTRDTATAKSVQALEARLKALQQARNNDATLDMCLNYPLPDAYLGGLFNQPRT